MATKPATTTPADATPERLSDALLAQFQPVIDGVPWADSGGFESIAARMLNATDWVDLNLTGKLPAARDLDGRRLRVTAIAKAESDLDTQIPVYLIVTAYDITTGESVMFQTSAGQPFLALAMLHHLGKLPAVVRIDLTDTLKSGFRAVNLTVEAVNV